MLQPMSVWDGVYTNEQADRGEKLYADRCARCHGDGLQGSRRAGTRRADLLPNWDGETLDALFERMRTSMPQDRPGSLTRAENTDLLAYMLRVAKYPAGATTLDAQGGALTRIRVMMYRPQPNERWRLALVASRPSLHHRRAWTAAPRGQAGAPAAANGGPTAATSATRATRRSIRSPPRTSATSKSPGASRPTISARVPSSISSRRR